MLASAGFVSAANRVNERYAARAYSSKLWGVFEAIVSDSCTLKALGRVRSKTLYADLLLVIPDDRKGI
jgi:hypothetical protein